MLLQMWGEGEVYAAESFGNKFRTISKEDPSTNDLLSFVLLSVAISRYCLLLLRAIPNLIKRGFSRECGCAFYLWSCSVYL